jgi:hypothetical protein
MLSMDLRARNLSPLQDAIAMKNRDAACTSTRRRVHLVTI